MTTDEREDIRSAQLTREEPRIDDKEPWKDDKLQRRRAADALANLVKAQRGPFVISLDGEWGTGKTFFLKRWKQQLENDKMRVIYFNAWQDDFFGDPLVPMLGQIMNTVEDADIRKRISESVTCLAYRNVQGLANKFTGATLPDFGDNVLKAYERQNESKNRLRKALDKMTKLTKPQSPLVFIVDELDRCRPDFAIATLERMKHVLDIPGLVFVYGVIVREALRMREKLESMGVWVDKGSRIVNPFGVHPDRPPAQQQPMPSGLAQLQPPRR